MSSNGNVTRARVRKLAAGCILLAGCVGAQAGGPATAAAPAAVPQLEPKAIELLKATSARLAAARTMTFTAVVSYEAPSRPGPALVYTTRSEVTVQRPDKLRVLTPGDGPASEFYYDGRTMTAFVPGDNLVATAPAPATIDAALQAAFNDAAIYFPFTDLIVADPYKDLAEGLLVAFYIGQSKVVGNTTTDMVAFGNAGVFAQIWIDATDKLPRKFRAVYMNDPLALRHDMDLSDWKLDPVIAAGTFSTPKAAGARRISFARPDAVRAGSKQQTQPAADAPGPVK